MERLQELERAILRHDPALDPPPRRDEPGERPRSSRRPRLLLAGAAAVMIVAAVGTAWLVKDSPPVSRAAVALAGNSVAAIDAETNAVVDEIPIGGRPGGMAAAGGYLWVGNRDGKTLLQIDPASRRIVRTIGLGAEPTGVAAGAGDLWIAVYADLTVLRVDPTTWDVVERIRVPQGRNVCCGLQIAFGGGSLWVTSYGALFRIDPATNALVNIRPKGWIWSLVYGERALWMMTGVEADRLEGLNPRTHAVLERMNLQRLGHTRNLGVVAAGAGAVWTTVYDDTTVWKIDTATGRIAGTVELGHVPAWASFGAESIWFTTRDGNLVRVDPRSLRVLATTKLGVYPAWLAATADEVWVTTLTP
jgi:YVTN family beta-propeller protein